MAIKNQKNKSGGKESGVFDVADLPEIAEPKTRKGKTKVPEAKHRPRLHHSQKKNSCVYSQKYAMEISVCACPSMNWASPEKYATR